MTLLAGMAALAFTAVAPPLVRAEGPPPIHEPFTVLPCPQNPVTTPQIEGCWEHKILRTDRKIDRQRRAILHLLPLRGRAQFLAAERSWLAYRRSVCAATSSVFAGGTFEPVAGAICDVRMNRAHIEELSWVKREMSPES